MPAVTVLIPTFERCELLKETLQSVLAQDFQDFRIVVIDNASTDNTPAVVRQFNNPKIVYQRHSSNVGLAANFMQAVHFVETPFFCWLGDDDLHLPGFLKESLAFFKKNPQVDFLWSRFAWFEVRAGERSLMPMHARVYPEGSVLHAADVLKAYLLGSNRGIRITSQVIRTDWYRSKQFVWGDSPQFDVLLRLEMLRQAAQVGHIPEVLHWARHHERRFTHQQKTSLSDLWRLDTQSRIRDFVFKERAYLTARQIGIMGPLRAILKTSAKRAVYASDWRLLPFALRLCLTVGLDLFWELAAGVLAVCVSPLPLLQGLFKKIKTVKRRLFDSKGNRS